MEKRDRILIEILFLLVGFSVIATFYKIAIKEDFTVFTNEDDIPAPMEYLTEKLWSN